MDPLTAFSLAGTIIQYLDFTTSLVRTTVEIHDSIKGLSSEVSSLEEVYTALSEFSSELETSNQKSQVNIRLKVSKDEVTQIHFELAKIIAAERSVSLDQQFLKNLAFGHLEERDTSITKAHEDTLEWIFNPTTDSTEGRKLLQWLKFGKGIFWVSGKAGSGKSPLMKFVAGHDKTQSALAQWAGPNEIFVISHYFWWTGSQMQKSQQGLLQTLLFGIFRQCPDLMQDICEPRWSQPAAVHPERWTLDELRSVFCDISKRASLKVNLCFFIDGLDEYDGDHIDICSVLQNLANESSHFKFCLSSRPWNVFENVFGRQPSQKIYVHDLAEDDIRQYARSRLCEHQRWDAFASQTLDTQVLVARITERARGVFLWVFLVTRLLRVGMSNNDRLTDLLRRLDSFPSDLEAFFKHMLQSVDPFYAPKMSTTLQITLNAKEQLSLSIYSFHEDEFEDAEYSLNLAVRPLERDTVQVAQRINGWCNGLLEVQGGTVHFIHRTVIDFFRTREITDFLAQKAPPNFCATLSLLKAHHAWFKSSPQYGDRELQNTLEYACWHLDTSQATDRTEEAFAILDDTEPCLREMQQQRRADFGGTVQHYFRYKLVMVDVIPYLSKRIPQGPEYFHGFDSSPLSTLLDSEVEDLWGPEEHQQRQRRRLSTIKCLLKNGEDPNVVGTLSRTPWITLLWPTRVYRLDISRNSTLSFYMERIWRD
ncbi:hypothetical protein LA080_001032 [Diaporthe eres]|nr:hypothetical protein LA080_001032 [Diaporthe eres]